MPTEQQIQEIQRHLCIILEGEFDIQIEPDYDTNVSAHFDHVIFDAYDFLDAICEYFQLQDIEQEVDITFSSLINTILALNPTIPSP